MKLLACLLFALLLAPGPRAAAGDAAWTGTAADGSTQVHLYFFWSQKCPHCLTALPFIDELDREYPWLALHSAEVTGNRDNLERYVEMAEALGLEARSVPAFFICGQMLTGYDSPDGMGEQVRQLALACRQAAGTQVATGAVRVPLLGEIEPGTHSLPVFTLVIAGLDAFNPCAFFVLLFLLSLMVHARSRVRMLAIGLTFVCISGLVYFLFMAAWLNLFLLVNTMSAVTLAAGALAVFIGALNTRDYFRFGQGPTLSIPEGAKAGLFQRMRGLLRADNMGVMLAGAVMLAVAANSYELLCTAGFPMVYTRVLTLNELDTLQYYGYLALYNVIYVLPLLAIVIAFAWTLGSWKLSEQQGRLLKLLAGLMMLELGLVLLAAPDLLAGQVWTGAVLLAVAAGLTTAIHRLRKT